MLKEPAFPSRVEMAAATPDVFGTSLGSKKKRTPQEIRELKEKISLISRVFSKNYDLDILPSPGGGWACGLDPNAVDNIERFMRGEIPTLRDVPAEEFKPKQILYDADGIADIPEDELMGIIRHEVGHANNTDFRLWMEGQRLAKDQGHLPTTWSEMANALEDPWVNNIEIAGSDVVREKIGALYQRKWLPEVVEKINSQPVTRQVSLNIIHYWLTGESIPTLKDKKVLDIFERIRPHAEKFFNGANPEENYQNLKDNIWPIFKELGEQATKDEQMKEAARNASGSDLGKEGGKGSGEGESESDKESLIQKIKEKLGMGKGKEGKGSGNEQLDQEIRDGAGSGLKKELEKELAKQKQAAAETDKKLKDQKQNTDIPADIDLSKLPQDVLDKLKKLVDGLSPEAKKELEKKARQNLDSKQAKALKKDGPKSLETSKDPSTGENVTSIKKPKASSKEIKKVKEAIEEFVENEDQAKDQAKADEADRQSLSEAEREARLQEELERQDMLKNGFDEAERDLYHKFKELENSVQQRVFNFIKILERYLPKKEAYQYGGENYTGIKLNKHVIHKRAPIKDYRIYERREIIESVEPRMFIQLLIDNSGSMRGDKMEESLKTAVFWGRVLRLLEIPFAIKFFGDKVVNIMKFEDDYDDPRKKIKPLLVQSADASGGSTNMGAPLVKANEEMVLAKRKFPGSKGAVFVISDSGANTGLTGSALKSYIEGMQKDFIVMNFILSDDSSEIEAANELFGGSNVVAPETFEQLPEEAFRILRVILERILKIYNPTS